MQKMRRGRPVADEKRSNHQAARQTALDWTDPSALPLPMPPDEALNLSQCYLERDNYIQLAEFGEFAAERVYDIAALEVRALRKEIDDLHKANMALISDFETVRSECSRSRAVAEKLRDALLWAHGLGGEFRFRRDGEGYYWWRGELRERHGLKGNEFLLPWEKDDDG